MFVQFSKLDLRYWTASSLSQLASLLGTAIMAEKDTQEKNMMNHARVLIGVPTGWAIPKYIFFENEKGFLTRQEVRIEWQLFCLINLEL